MHTYLYACMWCVCVRANHTVRERKRRENGGKERQQKESEGREGVVRGRERARALLLTECLCPPPPKIHMLKHNAQCYGIWKRRLLRIISGALMNEISTLIRGQGVSLSSFTMCWYNKQPSCNLEDSPHRNPTMLAPWSRTSSIQNCEK